MGLTSSFPPSKYQYLIKCEQTLECANSVNKCMERAKAQIMKKSSKKEAIIIERNRSDKSYRAGSRLDK